MTGREPLRQIGKYPVQRKLGEGATAEVYLCSDPFNSREVAVKLVTPEAFTDPERGYAYQKLFLTEASLAGKLQHPHICSIFDAVADGTLHYIVMEYVNGGTLERFCKGDTLLPPKQIVEIIFKCTRALEYAHRLGITHRDLKPANILAASETDVKITDFGTALIASSTTTQLGSVGSPAYMSPEQVRELPLDFRTDMYSIGVVMYHLLAGRLPFQASSNFALLYQIANADPRPPSDLRPDIPPGVDAIVLRAMARDREHRFRSWEEFSMELVNAFRAERASARKAQTFTDSDRFETLRKLPFFADFSDAELWEVTRMAAWRNAAAGERLMKEGDRGEYFCILAQGAVKVTKNGRLLNVLKAGEPFGEMAYLSAKAQVRGADVTVDEEANIISVPSEALGQASDGCRHKFDRAFMQILVERLSAANLKLSGV
ncbi:MAG TPA: protein kinase [Burkholderiales bacterium]|nr:protein kinase [Burkholderiales bacterium]